MCILVAARFYFLRRIVDAYSRYIVHHKLLTSSNGKSVAIEQRREAMTAIGVSVAAVSAVSADSEAQTRLTAEAAKVKFPLLYGMVEETMHQLGLYVSEPRSAQETDHCFPEPAFLVVNPQGVLHLVDIDNAPFLRPDLDRIVRGLGFIIEKAYPIQGTVK